MPSCRPVLVLALLVPAALAFAAPAAAQAVPPPPIGLTADVSGDTVTLTWIQPSGSPTTYVVEAGSAPGLANLANAATGGTTPAFATTAVPPGNYFVRVRARNAAGTSGPSSEVIVAVGATCQLPAAPTGLTATVAGTSVTLEWTGAGGSFQLEAGSAPGRADLFNGDVGTATTVTPTAPTGFYFVRVRERNACGFGPPSNDIVVSVGVPAPPGNLAASIIGGAVTFRWEAPAPTDPAPAGYLLEAGSAPGLTDLAILPVAAPATGFSVPGVPSGTYYVRVRAFDGATVGAPSNELAVTVGPPPPGTSSVTFTGLAPAGDPFVSHAEAGYLVEPLAGPWVIGAYGRPGPFIQFTRQAADPLTTGEVRVTADGDVFRFTSVDLYSSVTPIPYVFTGMRDGAMVFTVTGTVPNTFGNLATVPSAFPLAWIDTLVIAVSNPASPCCNNPAGLDNIVLRP